MKKVAYIVPYFGKLPENFQLWLNSCSTNNTIDWILFTDDMREFTYPNNVKINYCSFENIKNRIQQNFDFNINIDSPWHLSLFKPAYGEIFENELKNYDFWGHCDIDLIWGNIRKFISEDILDKYDKIGFQGHSLLYRNNSEVNSRYKTIVPEMLSYKDIFTGKSKWSFDENGMDGIYKYLNLDYYKEPTFAHLEKYEYSFYLKYQSKKDSYKNKRQIFLWENGTLNRYYIFEGKIYKEEFMYLHFFCRPMKYLQKLYGTNARYLIYPDYVKDFYDEITYDLINKYGKKSAFNYYCSSIWANRKKLTVKKVLHNVKRMWINKMNKEK